MAPVDSCVAVRPGEHACCRFARAVDRDRMAAAFVSEGLTRGDKVVYLADRDPEELVADLVGGDDRVEAAAERGQLDVRSARSVYAPLGRFDVELMLRTAREERDRAAAEGYPALSMIGEMSWAGPSVPGSEHVPEYEQGGHANSENDSPVPDASSGTAHTERPDRGRLLQPGQSIRRQHPKCQDDNDCEATGRAQSRKAGHQPDQVVQVQRTVLAERDDSSDQREDAPEEDFPPPHAQQSDHRQRQWRQSHVEVRLPVRPQSPLQAAGAAEHEREEQLHEAVRGQRISGRFAVRNPAAARSYAK